MHADRLDRGIDALAIREIANQAHDVFTRAVERMRGAEPARDRKAVVVELNHDDASRRIELRGEQGRKTDRTCAHDRQARSGERRVGTEWCGPLTTRW